MVVLVILDVSLVGDASNAGVSTSGELLPVVAGADGRSGHLGESTEGVVQLSVIKVYG